MDFSGTVGARATATAERSPNEMWQQPARCKHAAGAGTAPKDMGSGPLMGQLLEVVFILKLPHFCFSWGLHYNRAAVRHALRSSNLSMTLRSTKF
jgi:hypothetical protein